MSKFEAGQTVYVTKYALSKGIETIIVGSRSDEDCVYADGNAWAYYSLKRGEVWATLPEAQAKAKQMAEAALRSLAKRRLRLESIACIGAKVM